MIQEPNRDLDALAHSVIGAAIDVHRELGPGFTPDIYENSLAIELNKRDVPYGRYIMAEVFYKGVRVGEARVTFLVKESLVVAVKSEDALTLLDTAKVLSILKALDQPLGLLINFNVPVLKEGIRRVVLSPQYQKN